MIRIGRFLATFGFRRQRPAGSGGWVSDKKADHVRARRALAHFTVAGDVGPGVDSGSAVGVCRARLRSSGRRRRGWVVPWTKEQTRSHFGRAPPPRGRRRCRAPTPCSANRGAPLKRTLQRGVRIHDFSQNSQFQILDGHRDPHPAPRPIARATPPAIGGSITTEASSS